MEIEGYKRSIGRTVVTWIFIVLTAGLLRLIFHWWPHLMLKATHNRCPLNEVEKVLVIEQYQQKYKRYYVKTVYTISSDLFSASLRSNENSNCNDNVIPGYKPSVQKSSMMPTSCSVDEESSTFSTSDRDSVDAQQSIENDGFRNSSRFNLNLQMLRNLFSFLFYFISNCFRHCFCLFLCNTKDSSRTKKLFAAAGLRTNQVNQHTDGIWDQKLEQELKNIASPKLAVPKTDGSIKETDSIRLFTCKKLRYVWDDQYCAFTKLQGFDTARTNLLHQSTGLSIFQQCQRRIIYGNNEIKVEIQSILRLLFLEVLNPFYVFQIFSITLWLTDNYIYFAVAIIIMSVLGITTTIIQTRKNEKKLQATVQSSDIIKVRREGGNFEDIPTEHLVPGDVIVIPPHGYTMHCDAVLLSGNCIVNESMLTGESVPVTKIPLPNRDDIMYNTKEHARHTLFCGTYIIQTRYYGHEPVLAVVLRSGFLTAKGNLVRSIMYPPPVDYRFERDSYKFVAVLACIAIIGFIYSVVLKFNRGVSYRDIIIDSLDLITIVVPPALPAAMTVGRLYAQRRLQQKGIYCISPRAINVAGSLDCVCFDKTGTLTEEGLDLWGAVPTTTGTGMGSNYETIYPSLATAPGFLAPVRHVNHLPNGPLLVGMAVCHSLTRIDGDLIGDPLDLKMFEWTGWELEEPGVADNEKYDMVTPTVVRPGTAEVNDNVPSTKSRNSIGENCDVGIVRQFPFSSSLQRMSVITRKIGGHEREFEVYCKGSPEMIVSLSIPESVPENFTSTLERYTQHGYRVIAMARRNVEINYAKAQRVVRDEVEKDLTFLGLIVLENRLKPETTEAIFVHKNAGIRTVMVTGDNMLTAISVARECQMIEPREKVIVVTTEADKAGVEARESERQMLFYSYASKSGAADSEGTQSPVSVGSGCGSMMEQTLINVEAPANRYVFAITGNAFTVAKTFYPEILPRLLVRGSVFARMNPDQKQQLVEHLQELGYFVAMCGDGANDCGALKAAHAGISLSEAESSVASPFTSREANITCVPNLIREGRAALVTSFGIFKYMAIYSLTQFISVIVLYTIGSNLADRQFLYIDLFLISIFAFTFGHTEPYPGPLVKQPPSANLVSAPPIISIMAHMLTILGMQLLSFAYVQQQSWFTPYIEVEDEPACYENYAVFSVSAFQYIMMAIVFSQGSPYRKGFWTNKYLMVSFIGLTSLTAYIVLYPDSWVIGQLELQLPPTMEFRLILVGFAACNFVIALLIEQGLVNFILSKRQTNKSPAAKHGYLRIDHELSSREDWPPVSSPNGSVSGTSTDFSKRKIILPNGNKARTLERPPLSTKANTNADGENVRCARRHSSSVSIPIPLSDLVGLQPQFLAVSKNQSPVISASLDSSDSIATHINNCLNNSNFNNKGSHTECRIPLDNLPQHYQS
ncbi:unnamed protein product [Orchesella dallaii]|uniref:Cation-transporting ATPase n=1 Tax=Orchesella dallaii TaxID=48710 RepID=A0ABP1QRB6_9HEXA